MNFGLFILAVEALNVPLLPHPLWFKMASALMILIAAGLGDRYTGRHKVMLTTRGQGSARGPDQARASGHNRRMFDVILYQPQIPPNTGNVIRLCANAGTRLHLVAPLGFDLDDRQLRRAGLDYHEYAPLRVHGSLDAALAAIAPRRLFALSTRNSVRYDGPRYAEGDAFLFGNETGGLPDAVLGAVAAEQRLRLPMRPGNRSLNLSNAVAVVVFEAWRQCGFKGGNP